MDRNDMKYSTLCELGYNTRPDFVTSQDGGVEKINNQYESIIKQILARYRWGFAKEDAMLQGRVALQNQKYNYSFDLPSDFVFLRNQYSDSKYSSIIRDYEFRKGKFFTNADSVFIEYTAFIDESQWPDYFVEYAKYKLAYDLCMNVTGDTQLYQILEKREAFEYVNATNIDVRQRKVQTIKSSPFIAARG